MASRTVNQVIQSVAASESRITFDVADKHDGGDNHPGCLLAHVEIRPGEIQTRYLEHVVRSGEPDPQTKIVPITGKTPAPGVTAAQLTQLKNLLVGVFNLAAVDAGYTI
jgi:hypothetical protein